MKRFSPKTFTCRSITLWWIPSLFVAAPLAAAAPLQEARVSQVIQDVRLLGAHAAPRPAAVNDKVTLERAVRTGKESRAELTFTDLTITRLGANTIFSLKAGAREVDLASGTILLSVPSGAAPVKANTVGVTVAVTGGTGLLATGPPTKFMVLEGIGTIYPKGHPEKAVTVHGGEMVLMTADKKITQPEKFDVKLVLETSALIVDFPPLANLPLILTVMNQQLAQQQLAGTTSQPLARNLIDVIAVTDQNVNSNPILVAVRNTTPAPPVTPTPSITPPPTPTPSITPPPTPTPSITPPPTPSKFGTPTTITSPNPYLITNGTVITTDPSITTNGVTNFGTIYRGQADDGAFTVWAFGSTSAFDTALGIDNVFFADPNHLPIATFKFQSLSLTGNPTIDLSNGGGTKLALIGVDGITSGLAGGTLTFTGLDLLVLATVNGSINLTSDVSFQDLSELAMYARGAGSDLILDSPISNIGILELAAEGSIQLTNPGTMSVGEFDATAGNSLTLQIESLLLDGKASLNTLVLPGTTVATGANLTLNATGDYTNSSATEFSSLLVMNEGAHIETGGNIAVNIGGNLTATGLGSATGFPEPGDFEAVVQNTNGQIDNGGNLNLTVTGNVQVNGLAAFLQNYDETANPAGHIGTGGNIDVEIGGNFTANSYVDVFLNNHAGGVIDSGGNLTFNIGGALTIGADAGGTGLAGFSAEFVTSNRYDDSAGNTTSSFIGSDVSLFLHAASINMAGILLPSGISNALGSVINGNATATWDVPGNVMIQGTTPIANSLSGASWVITNDVPPVYQFTPPSGGTIHGSATLTLNIGGDLTIAGDASIEIENQRNSQSTVPRGGTIDSDATVNITAANFSVGGELDVDIRNRNNGIGSGTGGGSIGGNAVINLTLSGDLTTTGTDPNSGGVPGNAYFYIANESDVGGSGGFIGSDATINLQAGSISTAGLLDVEIDNFSGGSIGGNALINVGVSKDINIVGGATFQILNNNSGTIGGNATINMNVSGSATVTNDAAFQILGSDGAASAAINFNGGSYDAGGTFLAFIDGDGTITFNNSSAHADVLKVGALGTNGVLNIGGGTLSADTTLELYASGSKGQLNFVSNVTLGGNSIKILAANSVTIFNNIVVTIGGSTPAQVYTNNANYTGFGGNGTTTGTFAGAGANNPLPLNQAPPFGPSSPVPPTVTRGGGTLPSGRTGGTINVNNTAELLALLDGAVVGLDGRITIPDSKSATSRRDANQTNINRLSRLEHQLAIQRIRDRGITRIGGGKVAAAQ